LPTEIGAECCAQSESRSTFKTTHTVALTEKCFGGDHPTLT